MTIQDIKKEIALNYHIFNAHDKRTRPTACPQRKKRNDLSLLTNEEYYLSFKLGLWK